MRLEGTHPREDILLVAIDEPILYCQLARRIAFVNVNVDRLLPDAGNKTEMIAHTPKSQKWLRLGRFSQAGKLQATRSSHLAGIKAETGSRIGEERLACQTSAGLGLAFCHPFSPCREQDMNKSAPQTK